MTYIFAPVIQNDRLSGEPVTLLSFSGGRECTRLRRSHVNFWASWDFTVFIRLIEKTSDVLSPPITVYSC